MAARRTLDQQGIPQDDEGKQAMRAMESRLSRAQGQVSDHIRSILSKAGVQLGGGSTPTGTALRDRIENGAQSATARLFSKFDVADDARWNQVIERIKKGSGADALKAVGYDADPEQHPVIKEILGRIGGAGTPASEVEKAVLAAPFGWPRDALMGAIGVLLDSGLIRATINGSDAATSQVVSQTRLGAVHLRRESTVLKTTEKIAARSLLGKLGITVDNESLISGAEQAISGLAQRAGSIGGAAPLPDVVFPEAIKAVLDYAGNDRVHALLAAKDELTDFADRLDTFEKRRSARLDRLATARALSLAATDLDSAAETRARLKAFEQTRELLSDNDQIGPIATDLASAVREAVTRAADSLEQARQLAVDELQHQPAWAALESSKQQQLLSNRSLAPESKPELGDSEAVLRAVQQRPLASWAAVLDAVPARSAKALEDAVRLTVPDAGTVTVPTATLSSADDVETYLDDLRAKLTQALTEHDTVMVKA